MMSAPELLLALAIAASASPGTHMADSLAAAGMTEASSSLLLQLLGEGVEPREEILFRLVGVYHGVGTEAECMVLLDSLESAWSTDLSGWRISLLDLSGDTNAALALSSGDPLLTAWLTRREGLEGRGAGLPAPDDLPGRAVRAMSCADGTMTRTQINQTVRDSEFLPFLVEEVCDELEASLETAGPWWEEVAADQTSRCRTPRLEELTAARAAYICSGTAEYWQGLLDGGGLQAMAAANMLRMLAPQVWNRSWQVVDALAENGAAASAESLAMLSGDRVFSHGVLMAVLRASGRYSDLLAHCDSLLTGQPDSLSARAALFRARALRALQRPASQYYPAYLQFATAYPWHPTASEAACLAARFYEGERDWPAAADAYMTALRAGGYGGAGTFWRGGFCHYMCGRGAVGDSIWVAGIEEYPFSYWCDEMLFWRARYANRIGVHERERDLLLQTAQRHPWEFYGILASIRLGGVAESSFPVPWTDLSDDPVLAQAVSMYSSGFGAMASTMLFTTVQSDPGTRACGLALMGEWGRCTGLLRSWDSQLRASDTGILPDSLLAYHFPNPYSTLILQATMGLDVCPELVCGLMRQESGFDRRAGSGVGARGLIQLMPGTAGDIARWYGLEPMSGSDFYDPELSITFGSLYLNRQHRSFDGVVPALLAAYNAGPGNASRWMEEFPCEPGDPELFIEQITFTETRGYVKHVMANTWIYQAMQW